MSLLQERAVQERVVKVSNGLSTLWNALLARSGFVVYIPIIVAVTLMFLGASWELFRLVTDVARYQCYALVFWYGGAAVNLRPFGQCSFLPPDVLTQPPFHILPLEYPPLTLALFSPGLLAPLPYYQVFFAIWMALIAIFIYWLLLRYGPRGAGLTYVLYILIGGWATAEARFDLVPAALTLMCIIAAERKHWTLAYVALACGVLLKIYPILLFPPLFIAEQRDARRLNVLPSSLTLKTALIECRDVLCKARSWRWKNSLLFFVILLVVTGAFALLNFGGAFANQLGYFAGRPIQIEATGSALLWLAAQFNFPVYADYSYGSLNLVGALDGAVSSLCMLCLALGYIYAIWLQWRGKLDIVQVSIAILLVFIATGKVFSPQYLIWIIPLLAYSHALDRRWLFCWGLISLLTTLIYPYFYTRAPNVLFVPTVPGFAETIIARNILFVLVTLSYLFNWFLICRRTPIDLSPQLHTLSEPAMAVEKEYASLRQAG